MVINDCSEECEFKLILYGGVIHVSRVVSKQALLEQQRVLNVQLVYIVRVTVWFTSFYRKLKI